MSTYIELGERYRLFSNGLFKEIIYPEAYSVYFNRINRLKKRYADTLEKYKKFFKADPPAILWETVQERFGSDLGENGAGIDDSEEEKEHNVFVENPKRRVAVNLYRLALSTGLEAAKKDVFTQSKFEKTYTSNENEVKSTKEIVNLRVKAQKANELFRWRKHFPHCDNVYFKSKINVEGSYYLVNSHEALDKTANIFKPGGVLFIPNALSDKIISEKNISQKLADGFYEHCKLERQKDLSLDVLADDALSMVHASETVKQIPDRSKGKEEESKEAK